ncbi:uncharacterized protein [Dendrobates tinctorius]|uniref:uncharacterized protein n=1 Tax=Dendrobates tinctorius TaxID=92724 RepID=UPI003CC95D0B
MSLKGERRRTKTSNTPWTAPEMVWAHTERVGCGEKFCEKVEGFDDSNIHLLVCNYEPPGNFRGEKPYTPGEPCSRCPSSHICEESLCVDKSLDEEETSTAQPALISDITPSQLDPEPTPSQLDPEPTPSQLDPEPTPSQLDPEPTPSQLDPEPTPSQLDPEPTPSQLDPEPTPSQLDPELTPSQLDPEPTPSQLDPEPTPSQLDPEPTPSQLDSEPTPSQLDPEPTPSQLDTELTPSQLDPEPTPSQLDPEPTPSQLDPEPTPSQLDSEPTPSQLDPEPTPSQLDTVSTLSQLVPEQTPSQLFLEPIQSELVQQATQQEQVPEPTKSELNPDSTKSEMVPESTLSVIITEATTSKLDSVTTQISTVPLETSPLPKRKNSSPVVMEQTSVQPSNQVIAHPSQEYYSVSVSPLLHLDSLPHTDKTASNKAFSNDEPDVPTEKGTITPMTVSVSPTKPVRAHGTSLLVDKDNKPSENEVHTKNGQDKGRRKGTEQPSKTFQQKKLKNMNLTSFKWKNQLSSSMRRDYKSGPPEWTYFGRPVQGLHFVRAPRLCPYPCLSAQSKSPLVFPLHRTNHILPMGGYDKQSQILGRPPVKPSFKQLYRLLGYKRGVYSLYLPPAKQQ